MKAANFLVKRKYTHLVSKPKQPQNRRTHLYSAGTPHGHLPGGYKASGDFQAFEAFNAK